MGSVPDIQNDGTVGTIEASSVPSVPRVSSVPGTVGRDSSPNVTCPKCGSRETKHQPSGGHLGLYCAGCGHWYAWVKQPWTLERAESFVLFQGRYHGKTLLEVLPIDPAYVQHAATKDDNRGIAARMVIAKHAPSQFPSDTDDDIPF